MELNTIDVKTDVQRHICKEEKSLTVTLKNDLACRPLRLCKFFSQHGHCRHGAMCRYMHNLDDVQGMLTTADDVPDTSPAIEELRAAKVGSIHESHKSLAWDYYDEPPASAFRPELESSDESKKSCRFFSSKLGCLKGDDCDFLHYRSIGSADDSEVTSNFELVNNQIVEVSTSVTCTSDGRSDQVFPISHHDVSFFKDDASVPHSACQVNNFHAVGNGVQLCAGDLNSCSSPVNSGSSNSACQKRCRWFGKSQGCRKGNRCEFLHESGPENRDTSPDKSGYANLGKGILAGPQDPVKLHSKRAENEPAISQNGKVGVCKWFLSRKGCFKGNKCVFRHERSEVLEHVSSENDRKNRSEEPNFTGLEKTSECVSDTMCTDQHRNANECMPETSCTDQQTSRPGNSRPRLNSKDSALKESRSCEAMQGQCKYFNSKRGCIKKNECPFLHVVSGQAGGSEAVASVPCRSVLMANASSTRRDTEIEQLRKRFESQGKLSVVNDEVYHVTVSPSDPDWPFVVKEFTLSVSFPTSYPDEMFQVEMIDQHLFPPGFSRHMTDGLMEFITERQKEEKARDLAFRPFLRWLDKNFERLFTVAANKVKIELEAAASGIKLIPHDKILKGNVGKPAAKEPPTSDLPEGSHAAPGLRSLSIEDSVSNQEINDLIGAANSGSGEKGTDSVSSKLKKGTEIKFANLYLSSGVGTLRLRAILLTVQCSRCKSRVDFQVPDGQSASGACQKCHAVLSVAFYAEFIHQFSPVAGYLHLSGCKAFDLILTDSTLILNCMECSRDTSLKGMAYGSVKCDCWCSYCHSKMEILIEATRFVQLQPGGGPVKVKSEVAVKKKIVKDPNIKAGEPLPENGTCKHYRKSYRWFRFPCCGKAYPCDVCHEENEGNDHEMKFATRMICGFCAKEQPFSQDKPCVGCERSTTRSKSRYWEGGQGCRDQKRMSRDDPHKTAGRGKTISRKKQAEMDQQKKR